MKLLSAIALLGYFIRHVFAEPTQVYTPSGRFELKHGDPKMAITSTVAGLSGEVYFTSPNDSRFDYFVEYYDMADAGLSPTTCLVGTPLDSTSSLTYVESELRDYTDVFELPASVWNGGDTAVICARMKSIFYDDEMNGEDIDAIETIATITRSFTGEFGISIATRTKTAKAFSSVENENTIEVESFLCDNSDDGIRIHDVAFAQGQDFKICVAENTGAYQIEAITNVVCYFGDEVADTLVDASGNIQGLVEVSGLAYNKMRVTGVVKSKYLEYGNTELACTGEVTLGVAPGRRLDANNNVRFASRGLVMQNRDLQEHQTEFRVGIKLDPGSSSAATLMGLMGAGCVIALIVLKFVYAPMVHNAGYVVHK